MTDEMRMAEHFDQLQSGSAVSEPTDSALLGMAVQLRSALRVEPVDAAAKARIHTRALALAESAGQVVSAGRTPFRMGRRTSAVIGGAAALTAGAVLGYALLHNRRTRGLVPAAG